MMAPLRTRMRIGFGRLLRGTGDRGLDAAAEAPRAAAEVIAELRQKLSDSMVRDTELLAERAGDPAGDRMGAH